MTTVKNDPPSAMNAPANTASTKSLSAGIEAFVCAAASTSASISAGLRASTETTTVTFFSPVPSDALPAAEADGETWAGR